MRHLSTRNQILIGAGLALFMAVTRSPQIPGSQLLHTGSWAVFFIAGAYLRPKSAFVGLLALAFVLDALALGWGGVSTYCLTPAYAMLIPAYGCLWGAGRLYAGQHRLALSTLVPLTLAVVGGGLACEVFASASFYFLSGRFTDPGLGGFFAREAVYFPAYLATLALWVAVAAAVHVGVIAARQRANGLPAAS